MEIHFMDEFMVISHHWFYATIIVDSDLLSRWHSHLRPWGPVDAFLGSFWPKGRHWTCYCKDEEYHFAYHGRLVRLKWKSKLRWIGKWRGGHRPRQGAKPSKRVESLFTKKGEWMERDRPPKIPHGCSARAFAPSMVSDELNEFPTCQIVLRNILRKKTIRLCSSTCSNTFQKSR